MTRLGDELVEAVAALEALKSSVARFELGLLAHLDATRALQPLGWASAADFVTAVGGGHRRTGPATVRQARALEREVFAPVAAALVEGWLSEAKARVIVQAVEALPGTADHPRGVAFLLDESRRLDATELSGVARHLVRVVDPEGEDRRDELALERQERAAHHGRFLSVPPTTPVGRGSGAAAPPKTPP